LTRRSKPTPAGAEPELLRPDGHVPRRRHYAVDLDGVRPAHRLCARMGRITCTDGVEDGSRSARAHSPTSSFAAGRGTNLLAGQAMSRDWCGRHMVVFLPPCIDGSLGRLDGVERTGVVEELHSQGLMPVFHLPHGGRGERPGQPLPDAVAAADPLEQHLGWARLSEPAGELLAIVDKTSSGIP